MTMPDYREDKENSNDLINLNIGQRFVIKKRKVPKSKHFAS
jgi:hypothetical protein